jgi:voltage-gated potassium channel
MVSLQRHNAVQRISNEEATMNSGRRAELLDRFERATELPLLALALAIIPLLVVPLVVELSDAADRAFFVADWTIWAVFALDLGIRTYLAERRLHYLARHWFDVLIVVLPFLRPLRVLRSARALRLARLGPFLARLTVGGRDLLRGRGLQYVLLLAIVAVFACAGAVYLLEDGQGGTIDDPGTALWWAATTVTTVGYGDAVPITAEGRGVAVFLMLLGITLFSWLTANIAAFLVEFGGQHERTVTLGDLMDKLEALEAEVRALRLR